MSAGNQLSIIDRFQTTFIEMSELLQELFTTLHHKGYSKLGPGMLTLGITFIRSYSKIALIDNFIFYTYKHWDRIRMKDASYFETDADEIFAPLKSKIQIDVDVLKTLYTARDNGVLVISIEDQDAVWTFFQVLVKMAIRYIYDYSDPIIVKDEKGVVGVEFNSRICPQIDVINHAKLFGVKLKGLTV